jgi:signal transduction histidine kinase
MERRKNSCELFDILKKAPEQDARDARIDELSARLRAAEDALLRSERLAVASRYAGAIMHEVNNPLEALTNLVYITKNEPDDPDRVQRNMEIAEGQLLRLGEITRKTLSFYREQTETKDFNLSEIVESALKVHSHRTRRQNVDIRKRVADPAVASVFAGEILQILSNLILNSLDALPESAAVLCVRVKTSQGKVHITIADNGAGIEPSIYKNMFQPHRTTKSHGTGLGLWLSRRIIEKHNGTISCRSSRRPGRSGTTFRLSLPTSPATSASLSNKKTQSFHSEMRSVSISAAER